MNHLYDLKVPFSEISSSSLPFLLLSKNLYSPSTVILISIQIMHFLDFKVRFNINLQSSETSQEKVCDIQNHIQLHPSQKHSRQHDRKNITFSHIHICTSSHMHAY